MRSKVLTTIVKRPDFDKSVFGYTGHSQPRVGNFVSVFITYKGFGTSKLCEILAIDSPNDKYFALLKDIETGQPAELPVSGFSATLFYPENCGFRLVGRRMDHLWTNGLVVVHELTNPEYRGKGDAAIAVFPTLGFEVENAITRDSLLQLKPVHMPFDEYNTRVGLRYVHELQNLFADLLPDEVLDLSSFIEYAVNYQIESRLRLDGYAKEKDRQAQKIRRPVTKSALLKRK